MEIVVGHRYATQDGVCMGVYQGKSITKYAL